MGVSTTVHSSARRDSWESKLAAAKANRVSIACCADGDSAAKVRTNAGSSDGNKPSNGHTASAVSTVSCLNECSALVLRVASMQTYLQRWANSSRDAGVAWFCGPDTNSGTSDTFT